MGEGTGSGVGLAAGVHHYVLAAPALDVEQDAGVGVAQLADSGVGDQHWAAVARAIDNEHVNSVAPRPLDRQWQK
jgi:hypothetical protein